MKIEILIRPILDPEFVPAVLWNRAYRERCEADAESEAFGIALSRPDGSVYSMKTRVLSHTGENVGLNICYVERLLKFMLWSRGGSQLTLAGNPEIAAEIAEIYSASGRRAFDYDIMGQRMFLESMTVVSCAFDELPTANETNVALGRNLDGCRIGFDLGGSDRKCAAVIDGKVVFSEEVKWDPYFEADPEYHYTGIMDSLKLAAEHLPHVDAIGGSAAGVYVNNEPRVASLFRGVSAEDFDATVRPMFQRVKEAWDNVPFDVVNDGEVTALAGAMSLNDGGVLGIAMGTSLAGGYCDIDGHITSWLNELAFCPVDYRDDAPVDEWSGDGGCGVQYFSQQAVARLMPLAGIEVDDAMPLPARLEHVQALMVEGDLRAAKIYETIGVYFGYSLAWYAEFYEIKQLLLLGRVTSGEGGQIIIRTAESVLDAAFPQLCEQINISMPDEKMKRHGQAIAAASLPSLGSNV